MTWTAAGDLLWQVGEVGLAADAELAAVVPAPAPQGAAGADGAGVPEASDDRGPACCSRADDLLRIGIAGAGAVVVVGETKLANVVLAPAPQRAVGADGTGVVV